MTSVGKPADQSFSKFNDWLAQMTDEDYRNPEMQRGGQLSRTEIARQCGIVTSTLRSNPRIKSALAALEDDLRQRGILAPLAGVSAATEAPAGRASDVDRIRRLESDLAQAQAELHTCKKIIRRYELSELRIAEDARKHR